MRRPPIISLDCVDKSLAKYGGERNKWIYTDADTG